MDTSDVVIVDVFVAVKDVVTAPVEDSGSELEEEVSSKKSQISFETRRSIFIGSVCPTK